MNKKFDCVKMKHKAAEKIQSKITGFSTKEELAFWNNQTKSLKKHQQQLTKTEKAEL